MLVKRILLLTFCLAFFSAPAYAVMKVDVSESNIQVTTGFTGTSITVFGTQDGPGDVVLVIEGPNKDFTVRKKGRTLGLWTNVDSREFNDVPGYYEIAASNALPMIAPTEMLAQYHIGIDNLALLDKRKSNSVRTQSFRDAFLQSQRDKHLYVMDTRALSYVSPTLFKARFTLPAAVPSGHYAVYAYLFQNGQMIQEDQTGFQVEPVGASANIHRFAQDNSLSYGLVAVLIALFAGWLATVLLKRE